MGIIRKNRENKQPSPKTRGCAEQYARRRKSLDVRGMEPRWSARNFAGIIVAALAPDRGGQSDRADGRYAMRLRAGLLIACAGLIVSISGSRPASATIRQVVLLFGERVDLPALSVMEADITRTLLATSAEPVEVHIENLDLSQSASPSYKAALRDFLHEKYLNRRIDVAVAVMKPAFAFLLDFGDVI